MNPVPLSRFMPYGAPELLASARRHMTQALLAGSALCTLAFVLVGIGLTLHRSGPLTIAIEDRLRPHDVIPTALPPPPPMQPMARVRIAPNVKPAGLVVPVPPDRAEPDVTIADQHQLAGRNSGTVQSAGPIGDAGPGPAPPEEPPVDIVYVTEMPAALHSVEPEYPSIAIEAGVSGTVLTRVLVGKDGRVRDVQVDSAYSIPMLDDAAVSAARRWLFSPAKVNGHPVAVWVQVPFRFRLH